MNPKYPVFIPSKGRWGKPLTAKALSKIGVPFFLVVEKQEKEYYEPLVSPDRLLIVPHQNEGLVVTRNWIWDYADSLGVERFWTMDDNIKNFFRFDHNLKVPVSDGSMLRAIEDFAARYKNLPVVGMQYFMFVSRKSKIPPLAFNTRVYSNMLIETKAKDRMGRPFRNEGFFNDDTDLCLRILKDGKCTALFNAFLIEKSVTMSIGGGMTPYYQNDGRYKMALELQQKHPDVTKITRKWNRWQHQVDYRPFKNNKLIRRTNIEIPTGVNNYGMKLVKAGV